MKEEALKIKKKILPLKDAFEELEPHEQEELSRLQEKHDALYNALNDVDRQWYDNAFADWYAMYLDVETKIFIKPGEGC